MTICCSYWVEGTSASVAVYTYIHFELKETVPQHGKIHLYGFPKRNSSNYKKARLCRDLSVELRLKIQSQHSNIYLCAISMVH
jgi:hypothetical protein